MNEELAIVIRAKDEASGVLNGLTNRFGELANAARLLEGSLLAIGAALAAGAKFAGDYEASLDRIAAALDATSEDMKKIDASIREIASGSQFSFDAIAKAIERLVQTGYSANEAMGGLVQAAKDLATISRENIADVAERLGQLVRIFGEEGKNASTIADQMAKAMVSIGTSATELASALIKLSPIVTSGGDSLERLLALLELLNQRGLSVTEAVSGLQRAFAQFELLKVGEVSQKMADALERLGPAAQRAAKAVQEGRMGFIEFIDVIADLDPSFGTLVELFGQFGARVVDKVIPALKDVTIAFGPFSVTLKDTQRDFDRLVEQFTNVEGAAAKISATVRDNLPGAFREFGASLKNFLVDLVGGTEAIEKALKAVSSFLDKIGQFFREHGGLFGAIKEAFITLGTAVYDFFKEVGGKIVEFFKGIPKRIVDAFQSVWNALLEGLAAFFEKIPVIGQSIAEWLRGKKFEIQLATEVTAQITLSTVQATAETVDLSGNNVQAKVSEVVVRDVQNLTLPGFTSTAIQEQLSMPLASFVLLGNEAGSLASGFAMVNQTLNATGAMVEVLRIEEEKRREAQARQQALQQDINRGLDYLAKVLGRVLGPLQPLVDLLRGTIGPFTALLQILGNLIAQSQGFTRLLKAINKLLQPLADAIGAIFDAIAERILGPETETSGKKKEQESGQDESYQAGGYTRGPRHRIAGVVHGGEWVAPAWMVQRFPYVFEALEHVRRGYAEGGYVEVPWWENLLYWVRRGLGWVGAQLWRLWQASTMLTGPLAQLFFGKHDYPVDEFAAVRMLYALYGIDPDRGVGLSTIANIMHREYVSGRLRYISDALGGLLDIQSDAAATLIRGGGDCEDWARLVQVAAHLAGHDAFMLLVPEASHAMTGVLRDGFWQIIDFFNLAPPTPAYFWDVVDYVVEKFHGIDQPIGYAVVQDIKWNTDAALRPPGAIPYWLDPRRGPRTPEGLRLFNPAEPFPLRGWSLGGYVPIAGVVHGGEWVAPAWMVRKFPEVFSALERIRRGYQAGGYVGTGVVLIGQTNDLVSAVEEAADHVANTIVRTGNAIKKAVASLNIPTGYKLERAAWGVARPGEPWGEPEEEAIPQPVIGPEPSPEPGPEPSPEPPSEAPAPWREWVERLLDWIKPGIDAVVGAFKWLDSVLASLGIEQPLRGLIQLALAIVAMEAAWKTLTGLVSWASSAISDFILGLLKGAGAALWEAIKAAGMAIWPAIQGAGQAIWGGIQAAAQGIWPAIQGAGQAIWGGIQAVAQGIWPAIQGAGQAIWGGIQAVAQGIWPAIQGAGQAIWGGVQAVAQGIWPAIQSAGQAIWSMIASAGMGIWPLIIAAAIGAFALLGPQILEFFRNLLYGIAQLFVQVVDFIFQPIKWIVNGVIWVINSIIGVVNWALGWLGVRIPQIPYLQEGGYILREGLAYLHRGELVVPARAVPAGGVGPTIYIGEVHLHGVEDPEEFMARLEDYIRRRNLRGTGQRYGTYAIAGA